MLTHPNINIRYGSELPLVVSNAQASIVFNTVAVGFCA